MNFFNRILHYYIYDMRLKKKLVVSHTILFLIPTAVLICFLFLNIFRIVMDDTIRSEQALSSQSVLSVENLVSHVTMHITKKKRDAIVKLHRQGESIELLTAISGLNRTTITSIIKKDDSEKLFREFNMVSEKLSFER